jgi:hypothetical protein
MDILSTSVGVLIGLVDVVNLRHLYYNYFDNNSLGRR